MGRRRWIGVACLLLGAAGALAALLVGVADALLQPDRFRTQIAAIVRRDTGRALSLRGPMHIDWSLWPTLEVSDVRLANLPGGTRPDMARAERIEAQISLPALLARRIEVTRLVLIGPNILFEEVGGVPNWVFHAATAHALGAPGGVPLEFRAAHVQNGMVTFHFPARTNVIGIRALDLADPEARGPLSLSTTLVYADNKPFGLTVSAVPTGRVTDPWITRARFDAFDAAAMVTGRAALTGAYDVQVEARVPRLEALDALLAELRLPALHGLVLSTHLVNGPARGDLPVVGRTMLHVEGGGLGDRLPGLRLGRLELTLPAAGGTAAFSSAARVGQQALALHGDLLVPAPLGGPHQAAFHLSVRTGPDDPGPPATLSLAGRLSLDSMRFAGLDADLHLQAPSIAALRPVFPTTVAALTDLALTDLALDGRLRVPADMAAARLQDAHLTAREADLSGDVAVAMRPPLSVSTHVHATRLDLDALLPTPPAMPGSAGRPSGSTLIPDGPLPWRLLRGPTLDLALQADSIRLHRQDWPDLELALRLQDGRLLVSLPGGLLQGTISADANTEAVPVDVALRLPALPLALLTGASGLPGPARGSIRVEARLRAHGRSAHELAATLHGRLTLAMGSGTLSDAAVRQVAAPVLAALGTPVPAVGETAIRCVGLDSTMDGGIARISTLALDSSALTVSGEGEIDLGAEAIRLRIHPLARLAGAKVAVPVLVDGTFTTPHGRLQASALDKLALFIDAMFGGDHPETCADIVVPEPPASDQAASGRGARLAPGAD